MAGPHVDIGKVTCPVVMAQRSPVTSLVFVTTRMPNSRIGKFLFEAYRVSQDKELYVAFDRRVQVVSSTPRTSLPIEHDFSKGNDFQYANFRQLCAWVKYQKRFDDAWDAVFFVLDERSQVDDSILVYAEARYTPEGGPYNDEGSRRLFEHFGSRHISEDTTVQGGGDRTFYVRFRIRFREVKGITGNIEVHSIETYLSSVAAGPPLNIVYDTENDAMLRATLLDVVENDSIGAAKVPDDDINKKRVLEFLYANGSS